MRLLSLSATLITALMLAGCNNEGETMGNGPGNADGPGGRADPPVATSDEPSNPSDRVDPAGAYTTPDGTTEDTGATPRDPTPANH